jgi:Cof subfamily protein (haloacid dehalogenase superfamily)
MPDRIRLLLSDVDGTLVTGDKRLTEETKAAARELHDANIILAITSSRPPRGMRMLIEPLELQGAIGGFNGGVMANPDLSVIEKHPLDPQIAREALALILGQGLDAWLFTDDEWLIRDQTAPYVDREIRTLQFEPRKVASFAAADIARAVKIVGVSKDFGLMSAGEKETQSRLGERVNAARSQPYYLDVTHPQANKGTVVETLSRLLNIPPAQIVTMGDMPNDVLMFRKSGFSIAMGNASDEVKAQASAVTDSNENEGFAKAVRKFVLRSAAA